jgi:hypothetical protein
MPATAWRTRDAGRFVWIWLFAQTLEISPTQVPPSRRDVTFIEPASSKRFLLAPAERNESLTLPGISGNIALRWSGGMLIISFYKHLAPLEEPSWLRAKLRRER